MADYRLEQLSPRDFEHVVQALTIRSLGIASVVWGDGPDGGREATFEGTFQDPVTRSHFDGLIVVQAKFLQRPHSESAAQAKWALGHLKLEAAKYKPDGLTPPNAYIFATNAVLPPVDSGLKDQFREGLEAFRIKHGMYFALVWDFDQIRGLLDNARDVRIKYSCLTTPGDVLHAALEKLEGADQPLEVAFPRALQNEIQSFSTIRLSIAEGHRNEPLCLADVFVDLPATEDSGTDFAWKATSNSFGALSKLLTLDDKASPIVLLAGPGQGKTTVLTMLAQIHRLALLRSYDRSRLSPLTTLELDRLDAALSRLKLAHPRTVRAPFWIDTRRLGEFLAEAAPAERSIWHYLADIYTAEAKSTIPAPSLKKLILVQPGLLIIDGYDEAAPTQRPGILQAITEAVDEARFGAVDLAVVVSSRPQAYNYELQPSAFESWSLEPLGIEDARKYGIALLEAISDRSEDGLKKFEQATTHPEIQSLLSTPLHVSLMVSLVLAAAQLPRERYRLFQAYYEHVYERERSRTSELDTFLGLNRDLVEDLHRRVAFAIQIAAERSTAVIGLPIEEFLSYAAECVNDIPGLAAGEQETLIEDLLRYARERLVLIVGIDSGTVGFQIKPLTDFLAAAHLLKTADERLVRDRFRSVSHLSQWRDVARFMGAASFEQRSLAVRDMRDSIVLSLQELDDPYISGVTALQRKGASLAVDVLSDSGLDSTDRHARHLWPTPDIAVELMHAPGFKQTLAKLTQFADESAWIDKVRNLCHEKKGSLPLHRSSWDLLMHVARSGGTNAEEFARLGLESATSAALSMALTTFTASEVSGNAVLQDYLRKADPGAVSISSIHDQLEDAPVWARTAWSFLHGGSRQDLNHRLAGFWPLSGAISVNVGKWLGGLGEMPMPHHANWQVWNDISCLMTGSIEVEKIRDIAKNRDALEGWGVRTKVPWPLAEYVGTGGEHFGSSPADWKAAEERWRSAGIRLEDIDAYLREGSLTANIAERSFPFSTLHWSTSQSPDFETLASAVGEIWKTSGAAEEQYRRTVAEKILMPMADHALVEGNSVFDPAFLSEIVRSAVGRAPTIGADDNSERHHTCCATATSALAATEAEDDFISVAEGLLSWGWSSGVDDPSPHAAAVIQRSVRLLRSESFERLCRWISQRTSDSNAWEQLERHWLKGSGADDSDVMKRLLLMPSPLSFTRDDVRAAAKSDIWGLAEAFDRRPGWDPSETGELIAQVLIEARYSGVVSSSVFGRAKPMQYPKICDSLSALEL